jgi:hypothetical protein
MLRGEIYCFASGHMDYRIQNIDVLENVRALRFCDARSLQSYVPIAVGNEGKHDDCRTQSVWITLVGRLLASERTMNRTMSDFARSWEVLLIGGASGAGLTRTMRSNCSGSGVRSCGSSGGRLGRELVYVSPRGTADTAGVRAGLFDLARHLVSTCWKCPHVDASGHREGGGQCDAAAESPAPCD